MAGMVRPFSKVLDPAIVSLWLVEGEVAEAAFIFKLNGARFPIPAQRVGSDELGPFAILEEQRIDLGGRFVILVQREYQEPENGGFVLELGIEISLRQEAAEAVTERIERLAGASGQLLTSVNLLFLPGDGVSVYFNSLGIVDGVGGAAEGGAGHCGIGLPA